MKGGGVRGGRVKVYLHEAHADDEEEPAEDDARGAAGDGLVPHGEPAGDAHQEVAREEERAKLIPAATILLVRDSEDGLEVFMVVRHHQIDFASGALVFPGGKVDKRDTAEGVRDLVDGAEGLSDWELGMRVAAIREAFEESGVLLAREVGRDDIVPAARVAQLESYRQRLNDGDVGISDFLQTEGLRLALDQLVPFAHWITPDMMPSGCRGITTHLEAGDSVIVMGDLNDGPGLDEYEHLFGRSSVEIVLGDGGPRLHDPNAVATLGSKLGPHPTSARFYLKGEKRFLQAMLDYIMVSPDLAAMGPRWRIWHPFDDPVCWKTPELREALLVASDHFPVSLDIDL